MTSHSWSHAPRKARWRLSLAGSVMAALALVLLPSAAEAAPADVYVTDATDGCTHHCFVPENVTINAGESVTWISVSGEEHDITRCALGPCPHDGGTGASPFPDQILAPGETKTLSFADPGTYLYYCAIHGYGDMHGSITVAGEPEPTTAPPADFDADGRSDIGIYRPSSGTWFIDGSAGTESAVAFGTTGDIPVPGDYDGDGDVEAAVYRPSNGYWFVNGGIITQFGTTGDIPVPGDYDGDGDTDVAVYRPSSGYWFVQGGATIQFGTSGDIPVPGDYDGDGDTDVAVYRPSTGYWFVSGGGITAFGTTGDIPVPGDYDGDGDTDVAVYRPSSGYWFVSGGITTQFGANGDIPVPADYDGNGTTDVAVFRPSGGYWFVQGGAITQWGTSGDIPVVVPAAIRLAFFT